MSGPKSIRKFAARVAFGQEDVAIDEFDALPHGAGFKVPSRPFSLGCRTLAKADEVYDSASDALFALYEQLEKEAKQLRLQADGKARLAGLANSKACELLASSASLTEAKP